MVNPTVKQQKYLIKRRAKAKEYLGYACVTCGTGVNLEFDHIDPDSKGFDISYAIAKHMAWDKLVIELKKCQLLCKEHHVQKTRDNQEHRGGHNRIDLKDAVHGTSIMYHKFRCRCTICREYKRNSRIKQAPVAKLA